MMYAILLLLVVLGLVAGFLLAKSGSMNISGKGFFSNWLGIIGFGWAVAGLLVLSGSFVLNVDWTAPYAAAISGMLLGCGLVLLHKITREIKGWEMAFGGVLVGFASGSLFYKSVWVALPPQWFEILPMRTHLFGLAGFSDFGILALVCGIVSLVIAKFSESR